MKNVNALLTSLRANKRSADAGSPVGEPPKSDEGGEIQDPTNKGKKNTEGTEVASKDGEPLRRNGTPEDAPDNSDTTASGGKSAPNPTDPTNKGTKSTTGTEVASNDGEPLRRNGTPEDGPDNSDSKTAAFREKAGGLLSRFSKEEPNKAVETGATKTAADVPPLEKKEVMDIYTKIAASLIATEQGRDLVQACLEESCEADVAAALVKQAAEAEEKYRVSAHMQKQAAAEQSQAYEFRQEVARREKIAKELESSWSKMSEEERTALTRLDKAQRILLHKVATFTGVTDREAFSKKSSEDQKKGQELFNKLAAAIDDGSADAAAMLDMEAEGADPMAAAEAPPTIEEMEMILQEMVAAGEITEEEALQALEAYAAELGATGGQDPAALEAELMAEEPELAQIPA